MLHITYSGGTHIGRVRKENQDSFGKFPLHNDDLSVSGGQLFIVADGMGGHRGGKMASDLAVQTVASQYEFDEQGSIPERLSRALRAANAEIYRMSAQHAQYSGMGTTCTALVLTDRCGYAAHVGDSRLYLLRDRTMTQLTNDHSVVADLVRKGMISPDEARHHPDRSMLYRALGTDLAEEIDLIDEIPLAGNELFLLCTDGLTGPCDDEEIRDILLSSDSLSQSSDRLLDRANQRGGTDNITVQVIRCSR